MAVKGQYNQLQYKKGFDDEYEVLAIRKERNDANIKKYNLKQAYSKV